MPAIPAPSLVVSREEWPEADFDLPEGELLHATSDKDPDDEDWDMESNPSRSPPRRVRATGAVHRMVSRFESAFSSSSSQSNGQVFTIRPPLKSPDISNDNDLEDEGTSTIKAAVLPTPIPRRPQSPIDDNFEDAFALPSDLMQLSLAPLSLNHRSSKNSLEWGDKDQTSSSQSSDAYSSLGFTGPSSSSNSTSSASQFETETEENDDDDELDGLVLPSALFESNHGAHQLSKMLNMKKQASNVAQSPKVIHLDPEEDFEMGLVIDDDVDFSPSRLLGKQPRKHIRSQTAPPQRPSSLRQSSRSSRAKSPLHPPPSSTRQLQRIQTSPIPPLPSTRSQSYQTLSAVTQAPASPSFLLPRPSGLRSQKSYSGLKPSSPPPSLRSLTRKASLSSLIESSHAQASSSGHNAMSGVSKARYEEPTAASRAKSHKYSTSRAQDFKVPPTRPHTPSSNPTALRLTMPSQLRTRIRPALSTVFGSATGSSGSGPQPTTSRATSPPARPPSSSSISSQRASTNPIPPVPKVLRRPKRQRTYGDGTELDGIEDLPTDSAKEHRFRVQPKSCGNRTPGASYPPKANEKGTIRTKTYSESSAGQNEALIPGSLAPPSSIPRRTMTRIETTSKHPSPDEKGSKKKSAASPQQHAKRKPTLIRNLGSSSSPKLVGEMKWNPFTLRWEGNDHVLRDFDSAVGTSTRPALITHLTGSSIGSPMGFASGARIVGNMIFDPTKMCWVSTLPPEEDEPDVFANLADDEDDSDAWQTKGGTIRANLPLSETTTTSANSSTSSRFEPASPAHSHTRTISESESGSERGSRASISFDVDETFLESCRRAEERHRTEMKGWMPILSKHDGVSNSDRSSLYEIRALATRKY